MTIPDRLRDPRLIREINCGILEGLRLGHGLPVGHVVVVESDPNVRAALRETLSRAGYRVTTAGRLADALRDVRRVAPELVLTNVALEDADGPGIGAALRATRNVGKIAAYGTDDRRARQPEAGGGADALVEDPLDPACLLGVVRDLLELPDESLARGHVKRPRAHAAG